MLLVSAGEGSGDAMAAPVVRRLGVDAFGLGGAELRAAGVELLTDASSISRGSLSRVCRSTQPSSSLI